MLRASRAVLSAYTKSSTGITGLAVVPNAREVLTQLYNKTLNDIKIIPEHVPYRQLVEKFTTERLNIVKQNEDIRAIEVLIGAGQVEEVIEQAKNELELIPEYASWKLWEEKKPAPTDDWMYDIYDELEYADPGSVINNPVFNSLAQKKREEFEQRRKQVVENQEAAAAAAAASENKA